MTTPVEGFDARPPREDAAILDRAVVPRNGGERTASGGDAVRRGVVDAQAPMRPRR
jgi:hypothetical protein